MPFDTKADAREHAWAALREHGQARFPFPTRGRIPNFVGAEAAARRLLDHPLFDGVRAIKVNPDSPQRPLREEALRRGIVVYVPTPRLAGGFLRFDPARIPSSAYRAASSLSRWAPFAEAVPLQELPQLDLIVTGCVAVTPEGARCGKGHGYSDIEWGILNELGHAPVPVVTTVHPLQVVDGFPVEDHDLRLTAFATPDEVVVLGPPDTLPAGIDWSRLTDADLAAMPVLQALRDLAHGAAPPATNRTTVES